MFLNPLMFLGMVGVSVPIIIHLLNKRKFERVVWAAMRFLHVSVEQNQRRIRIEDIILLILRCLLVALIVLALTRPVGCRAAAGVLGQSQGTFVIILDNSYSMSTTDGVQSRFDQSRKAASQIIDTLPAGSSVAVLLASDTWQGLIQEPTYGLKFAKETVEKAQLCDRGSNLFPAVREAINKLKGRPQLRKEFYLITDGQASAFQQIGEIRALLEDEKTIRGHILLVGDKEEKNLGVSDLFQAGDIAAVGQPLRFEVRVKNYAREEARDVKVSISVDSDPPMEETTIESVGPSESKSVSLFVKLRTKGFHTVTARIPPDHLPADDSRTIAVRALEEAKVLLVDGDPGREARDSEVFFVRNALQPVPAAERDQYFIKTTKVGVGELEQTRFDEFSAVVLANVADLSPATLVAIEQYVRGGGGLMVFPGSNTNKNFYNEELLAKRSILPAAFGEVVGDEKQDEKFFALQGKGLEHPISALWNNPRAGRLVTAHYYKAYELIPPAPRPKDAPKAEREKRIGDSQVIFRFAAIPQNGALSNKPAVIEHTLGDGRVVMFASTAATAWNDLPVQQHIFVPLMGRILASLAARQDEHLNVRVGEKLVHRTGGEFVGRDALITRPRAKAGDPKETSKVEMLNGQPIVEYGARPGVPGGTDLAGAYSMQITGDTNPIRFAVQSDPMESEPATITSGQKEQLAKVAQVVEWKSGMVFDEKTERDQRGSELWGPIAAIAFMLAAMEALLAHWFSKSK